MASYSLTFTEKTTDVGLVSPNQKFKFDFAEIHNVVVCNDMAILFKIGNWYCQVHTTENGLQQVQVYQGSMNDDPQYWSNETEADFKPVMDRLLLLAKDMQRPDFLVKTYLTTEEIRQAMAGDPS